MTNEQVKNNIWRNSISNYLSLALRMGLGLVLFRMLYQSLSKEDFGFWALLWSVFGYGILLDFGFGFTAQKRVAELSAHQKWDQLSQVLSTIFFLYLGIAVIIMLSGAAIAPALIKVLKISAENEPRFLQLLYIFFIGMGFAFSMGVFPEILRGQQRICLANNIFVVGFLINFALIAAAIKFQWGIHWLLIITLGSTIGSDLVCGFFALRDLQHVRIRPALFSRAMVHDTMRFSVFAYITTLSNLILVRTDQLVISSVLAVSAVSLYQAGAKVGEMFGSVTQQLPDTLSPAAAHLNAKGDKAVLQKLLVDCTRFSVMVATPLYIICAFYMEPILMLLTGDSVIPAETFWTGEVLLLWFYMLVITQGVSKRIFMMCGHERRLTWLSVGEALLNLGLSVLLISYFRNVVCVAVGSLLSTLFFGWIYLWPWAAREAAMSGWKLARLVLAPSWVASLPLLALILIERSLPSLFSVRDNMQFLVMEAGVACVVGAWGAWRLGLNTQERQKILAMLCKTGRRSETV